MATEDIFDPYGETDGLFDESFDDPLGSDAEFLPFIGQGIQRVGQTVGSLLGAPSIRRPPLPSITVSPPSGGGVGSATLSTPAGNATIRLPERVVTQEQFKETTGGLQEAINRNTARLNTTQQDITSLGTRVGTVVAETRREIGQALTKVRREQRAALVRLKQEQSSQNMMNMMVSMMLQQQIVSRVQALEEETDSTSTGGNNMAMMMLPMMMMGSNDSSGGGGANNMMMPMMMMVMANANSSRTG